MKRSIAQGLLLAAALSAIVACDEPAPTRIRLFDAMAQATTEGLTNTKGTDKVAQVVAFDFDARVPEKIWFARNVGRNVEYEDDLGVVEASGGREGGALRIGPGVAEDMSRAAVIVPVPGLARVRVMGRVRLENNPEAESSSSREALRVLEHDSELEDPRRRSRFMRRRAQRVSRRLNPSGWDTVELSFITGSSTRALELQLLHRSGDSAESITRFDDLVVESVTLTDAEIYDQIRENYRPNDGNAEATPWRMRVSLSTGGGGRGGSSEVRDCVLLPPPAVLSIPVRLPAAEIKPVLRFGYGMVREAHSAEGDGARIEVRFRPEQGDEIAIGSVAFDPKNEADHRSWQSARFDLSKAAGREGHIVFASVDPPGEGRDVLDAVLLATPRIEPAEQPAEAFNVLLIGIDTLRADRMSAFGYERPTTLHLEKLADQGVRFTSTRSQAPWTLPSFAAVLTSLYPSTHGAGKGGHDEWTPIDPATTSLAEILTRVGYETDGKVANGFISPRYGLDQGFEGFQSAWSMESAENDAEDVSRWVNGHRTTPWMFFWHIMDPHLPYSTAASFRDEFTAKDYDGRFARGWRGPSVPFGVLDPRPGRRWFAHEGPPPAPDLEDDDRQFVHDYYDAEIAETDAAIGRVLDAIRASGQWDRTIIALVADHGEGLGDHNHYHHGYTLFDDQVHIPMLLRIPGQHEGKVVDRPVAGIDLAPTILGALGLEPPEFFRGVDRLAPDAPTDDAYFVEYPTYDSSAQKAWVQGRFKYLHDPLFHTEALYDIEADPGEKKNVLAEHPDVVARARAEMDAFRWDELQLGRFHMRVVGKQGQRLTVSVKTDGLFDANFTSQPLQPENDFSMDLDRQHWKVDTALLRNEVELVFWCRGRDLKIEATLDGKPCPVDIGATGQSEETPLELARTDIPTLVGENLERPKAGVATLWLEAGVSEVLPVVLSPEEIERLRQLGYTK